MRRMTTNWVPAEKTLVWATQAMKDYNLHIDLEFEIEHFRNYHIEKGTMSSDWDARFKTWLGNDIKEAVKQKAKSPAAVKEAQKYARIRRVQRPSPGARGKDDDVPPL